VAELTDKERDLAQRLADNPMDQFQGKTLGWLEDFIRITVGSGGGSGGGNAAVLPVGFSAVIQKDLTAETAEYVYTDSDGGEWLYCNGVAVSQTTYADLYAFYGANAFGTDSGGNFFLPDARGRAMFLTGTHTDTDLGDNDGVAVASRTAKHGHTNGATITGAPALTGAPGIGTLALSNAQPFAYNVAGAKGLQTPAGSDQIGYSTPSLTGAPSIGTLAATAGTLAVGGTIGTGTPVDTPAHLFIGSLLVRF
jgi:microcystin-dependent protein